MTKTNKNSDWQERCLFRWKTVAAHLGFNVTDGPDEKGNWSGSWKHSSIGLKCVKQFLGEPAFYDSAMMNIITREWWTIEDLYIRYDLWKLNSDHCGIADGTPEVSACSSESDYPDKILVGIGLGNVTDPLKSIVKALSDWYIIMINLKVD